MKSKKSVGFGKATTKLEGKRIPKSERPAGFEARQPRCSCCGEPVDSAQPECSHCGVVDDLDKALACYEKWMSGRRSSLTIEAVRKSLEDWKARDPRGFSEMRLIAAVAKLSVDQLNMIAGCAEAGLFSFELTPSDPRIVREVFLEKGK